MGVELMEYKGVWWAVPVISPLWHPGGSAAFILFNTNHPYIKHQLLHTYVIGESISEIVEGCQKYIPLLEELW